MKYFGNRPREERFSLSVRLKKTMFVEAKVFLRLRHS